MKKTPAQLKKQLWKIFSQYVRARDNYTCFTCGRKGEGSGMHAGHFISKSVGGIALYFHEDNVHAQCYHCNINLGGNSYVFGEKLGKKKVEELRKIQQQITKVDTEWYMGKIYLYTQKLKDL